MHRIRAEAISEGPEVVSDYSLKEAFPFGCPSWWPSLLKPGSVESTIPRLPLLGYASPVPSQWGW